MSYHGGVQAEVDLRTLVLECLRSAAEVRPNLDIFIHVYTKGESPNAPIAPRTKDPLADFRRGFNSSDPLQPTKTQLTVDLVVLEVSLLVHHLQQSLRSRLPVGITDLLLKSLKSSDCVKVVVAKPCSPTFQAMIKAQRQNGELPDKLMELNLHLKAVRAARGPYHSFANRTSQIARGLFTKHVHLEKYYIY